MKQLFKFGFHLTILALVGLAACGGQGGGTAPTVVIAEPPHASAFNPGEVVAVKSSASDAAGITRVELLVDGTVVSTDTPPSQSPKEFTLIQRWTAEGAGARTLLVRATNASGATGETGITVNINGGAVGTTAPTTVALITPTTNPSGTTAAPCAHNAALVTHVTIPNGTQIAPGSGFLKSWTVLNNGTCNWEPGTFLVLVGGEQLGASGVQPVPAVSVGGTSALTIQMQAPTDAGIHSSAWRLRAPDGQLFGETFPVVIEVLQSTNPQETTPTAQPPDSPTAAPAACEGRPNDFGFSSSTTSLIKGQSATLNWGPVTNATSATLNGGVFSNTGIPTPGQREVQPATTTTYSLRALCAPSGQDRVKSITINVTDPADLGPLNGNFVILVDGENEGITEAFGRLVFRTYAGDIDDPFDGVDGGNIAYVDLWIYDDQDQLVYERREMTVKYCAFSGGDGNNPCNVFVFSDNNNRWPNSGPEIIDGGQYTLRARAYSKDGRTKNADPVTITVFLD